MAKEHRGFLRRYLGLAIPISFQFLMWAIVPACDAFMLWRVGQDAMAAVSLASQVPFIMYMLVAAFSVGVSVLGAQYYGKGDDESIGKVFRIGVKFTGVISGLFGLVAILKPQFFMSILTNEPALKSIGCGYLGIAGFSYLLVGVLTTYHNVLKAAGHTRMSVGISIGTAVVNVVLNAVFIYGLGLSRPMGANGAALATVLAISLEGAAVWIVSRRRGFIRPRWRRIFERYPELTKDYLKCALPILGAYTCWGMGLATYTAIFGHLGSDAAAANAVTTVVRDLLCCLCEGGAAAASIVVGHELGKGNLERGRIFGAKVVRISIALGIGCSFATLIALPIVQRCVILNEAASGYLTGMMIVLAVYQFGRYVNSVTIAGVFTGGGDTAFDFYSLASTMWGLAVPMALLGAFVFHWPVALVFACTCIDEVGKLPWTYLHYRKYLWVKDLTREAGT